MSPIGEAELDKTGTSKGSNSTMGLKTSDSTSRGTNQPEGGATHLRGEITAGGEIHPHSALLDQPRGGGDGDDGMLLPDDDDDDEIEIVYKPDVEEGIVLKSDYSKKLIERLKGQGKPAGEPDDEDEMRIVPSHKGEVIGMPPENDLASGGPVPPPPDKLVGGWVNPQIQPGVAGDAGFRAQTPPGKEVTMSDMPEKLRHIIERKARDEEEDEAEDDDEDERLKMVLPDLSKP
eukprot:GHVN01098952.1.p1 GENE.GHVN01098952.1~~GHVN01098952.1.p1  ORF type:complete len:233 (-),score=53.98 GHVN01098952.1:133-831(-)